MPISRRKALQISGSALTGISLGALTGEQLLAQGGQQAQEFPDTLVDGDGDSLPDAFELAHGLDATNPLDALLDPDGDGLTTRMEYSRGLDPIVPEATAPVIAPAGGTFDDVVIVSMSTFTSAAQIYFTVDGSTPSPASTLYSGPFVLLASSTVRARAVRTDFVDSAVTSATFTVTAATPDDFTL